MQAWPSTKERKEGEDVEGLERWEVEASQTYEVVDLAFERIGGERRGRRRGIKGEKGVGE